MNKAFKDLQCGDYVYLLDFATLGAPIITKDKITDIKHTKNTASIKTETFNKYYLNTRKNIETCVVKTKYLLISNKKEAINLKRQFLEGMIKNYKNDIKRLNKNIKEYTKYLNDLNNNII